MWILGLKGLTGESWRVLKSSFTGGGEGGGKEIEITSWKAHAYGIFTRVGEVSEIERVSAANE